MFNVHIKEVAHKCNIDDYILKYLLYKLRSVLLSNSLLLFKSYFVVKNTDKTLELWLSKIKIACD